MDFIGHWHSWTVLEVPGRLLDIGRVQAFVYSWTYMINDIASIIVNNTLWISRMPQNAKVVSWCLANEA